MQFHNKAIITYLDFRQSIFCLNSYKPNVYYLILTVTGLYITYNIYDLGYFKLLTRLRNALHEKGLEVIF